MAEILIMVRHHVVGIHAPSAYPDREGGVIAIFNMNTGKEIGEDNYTELMTLPWRLTLDEDERLQISPAGEYSSLRGRHSSVSEMQLPANKEIPLPEISGDAIEIDLTLDPKDASAIELKVLCSPEKKNIRASLFIATGDI